MTGNLTLYFHPLSSYCQKALVALYETETPFTPLIIDLGDPESRAKLTKIWPIGKFPVLRDEKRSHTVPEGSIIIEYLARHYPGQSQLVPTDPDKAREVRMWDRFFDLYINDTMGKIVDDKIRPEGKTDPHGVERAKALLQTAYGILDRGVKSKTWIMGKTFTMADCAAAPALYYANQLMPLGDTYKHAAAYLDRLSKRPSYVRVFAESQPYLHNFPG